MLAITSNRFTIGIAPSNPGDSSDEVILSPQALVSLALFVLVSTVSPGGATTLATASGANFGFRRSLPLIAGIAAGLASMAAAAAAGLAGVLLALPSLQLALKALGSLYLLWLAWQIAIRGPPHLQSSHLKPSSFVAGIWMLWHNPKGWAMTIGAAASFGWTVGTAKHLTESPSILGLEVFALEIRIFLPSPCSFQFILMMNEICSDKSELWPF